MKKSSSIQILFAVLVAITITAISQVTIAQPYIYWGMYLKGYSPTISFDSQDMAEDITLDNATGDTYVVGRTNSVKPDGSGSYTHGTATSGVAYLARISKCGVLQWVTYLGNDNSLNCTTNISCTSTLSGIVGHGCSEWAYCVIVDHESTNTYIYIGGEIMQGDNPALVAGITPYSAATSTYKDNWDGFIAKYNTSGTLLNWTYVAGSNGGVTCQSNGYTIDEVLGLAVDDNHDVYATGYTESSDLGVVDLGTVSSNYHAFTPGDGGDAFIARFDKNLTTLYDIEYIGDDENDRAHSIKIARDNVFQKCMIIGGTTQSSTGIYIDNDAAYGYTSTTSAPYDNSLNGQDAFVLKWDLSDFTSTSTVKGPNWATYVGGSGVERGRGLDVDAKTGDIYFTGWTTSSGTSLGTTTYSMIPSITSGGINGYLAKISAGGQLTWMTLLGGNGDDKPNSLKKWTYAGINYIDISGSTTSTDLATTYCSPIECSAIGSRDAWICEVEDCDPIPGYCTGPKRQFCTFQTYLGGSNIEFDTPKEPCLGCGADDIWNSYGPSLDATFQNIYVAFSTKSTDIGTVSGVTNWGTNGSSTRQDANGDAFVCRIARSTPNDGCGFRVEESNHTVVSSELSIQPNPFAGTFNLSFESSRESTGIIIVNDIVGNQIFRQDIQITEGANSFDFDLSSQPQGIYLCQINYDGHSNQTTIVKQ